MVLVGNEKGIVYQKAFGVKNPLTNEKYATDDIFRIASMTKAITSVAVESIFRLSCYNGSISICWRSSLKLTRC